MKTIDIFGYSFSAIKLRKLRAALTTLGVIIGIAAIVALLSITQGLQATLTHQLNQGLSANTLIVTPGSGGVLGGATGGSGGGQAGGGFGGGPAEVEEAVLEAEPAATQVSTYTLITLVKLTHYRQT
jgi:ABC-type antimicrobial peptide transport system permease subunit